MFACPQYRIYRKLKPLQRQLQQSLKAVGSDRLEQLEKTGAVFWEGGEVLHEHVQD